MAKLVKQIFIPDIFFAPERPVSQCDMSKNNDPHLHERMPFC